MDAHLPLLGDPIGEPTPFQSLPRSRLVDAVTDHLREQILSGELEPGTALPQIELSGRLGISRTPLREAFRILESEGLVRIYNGNGTIRVSALTTTEVYELYELREVIDGLAARLAARNGAAEAVLDELEGCLTAMEESSRPTVTTRFTIAHARFHTLICETCGNSRLNPAPAAVRLTTSALRPVIVHNNRRRPDDARMALVIHEANRQHRSVFEAIRDRDEKRAESAARRHIAMTMRSRLVSRLDEMIAR